MTDTTENSMVDKIKLVIAALLVAWSATAPAQIAPLANPNLLFQTAGSLKVAARDEDSGLDMSEHGESAYPAFNGMDN